MTVAVIGAVAIGEWSEAATVIFLFAVAQYLESRSMDRARHAVRALMDLTPPDALVVRGGHERRVPVDDVAVGDVLRIRPGSKVPLDGTVVSGSSDVNQAPITGESLPVDKHAGDGAVCRARSTAAARWRCASRACGVTPRLRASSTSSSARRRSGRRRRCSSSGLRGTTRPLVITIAAAVALVPPLIFQAPALDWVYRALVLLVISCPCALVISTPVSIVSALAAAARHGVLVKGGVHLERSPPFA